MDTWKMQAFDVIIVGSGPGGGIAAKELSQNGKKVLILERGSGEPIIGTPRQCIKMALIPGKSLLFTQQLLALIRGITYGGSSIMAYACSFDPPLKMFRKYGIELEPEIEELKRELPITPLADDLLGPAAKRLMESAQDLGFDWQKLDKFVFQENCRTDCDKCTMGCPYDAKWTSRHLVDNAIDNNATLLTNARVKKVITTNNHAEGVIVQYQGHEHKIFGENIILSAGGIGTPLILRSSGISNAGYNFFFDPLIVALGTAKNLNGGKEFPMSAGFRNEEEGYVLTDIVWPRWIYWLFASEALRFDRLHAHKDTLPIMVKVRDELGGHLTKRGGVRKKLTQADKKKLDSGYQQAEKILKNAGAKHIFKTWYMATHPGGTAKVNDVVDANLQTRFNNLYVSDCSVIPESWGLPPTLAILALGKRLSKHLLTS